MKAIGNYEVELVKLNIQTATLDEVESIQARISWAEYTGRISIEHADQIDQVCAERLKAIRKAAG